MNVEKCSQVDWMNKFQQIIMLLSLVQIYLTLFGHANDNVFKTSNALFQDFCHLWSSLKGIESLRSYSGGPNIQCHNSAFTHQLANKARIWWQSICGIAHTALNVRGWPWKGRRSTGRNEERGSFLLGGNRPGSSWWPLTRHERFRSQLARARSFLMRILTSLLHWIHWLWRSVCTSLILCRLAGRDPMQLGAAMLYADWLDGRTLGD
jgi:hypothetical protein